MGLEADRLVAQDDDAAGLGREHLLGLRVLDEPLVDRLATGARLCAGPWVDGLLDQSIGRSKRAIGHLAVASVRKPCQTYVDRWVWYAGWTDKIATVLGSVNPVAGPYVNFSTPVPTGVIGVLAPAASALTGLVDVLAPVLATGCTAVVVASAERPLPAVELAEVLATSDVPGGVVNLLTGRVAELGPWLAAHADVDGLDLAGAPEDVAVDLERAAADTVKRVLRPGTTGELARLRAWTELTTVWHPVGR